MRAFSLRLFALSALSGALQVLPFPIAGPVPVWRTGFCWVALLPLLAALTREDDSGGRPSLRRGFVLGYVAGITWYLGNCYWIYQTMYLYGGIPKPLSAGILLLFCLYLGLYHGLFGVLIVAARRGSASLGWIPLPSALLVSPFVWVAVEYARAKITGFPWDLLGVTQVDNPLLTRLAPVTGVYGLSFVIAAVNALWLLPIVVRERRYTRPVLTLAGVVLVVGYVALIRHNLSPRHEGSSATAVLLQENLLVGAENTGPQLTKSEMLQVFSQLSLAPQMMGGCDGIPELARTRCAPVAAGQSRNGELLGVGHVDLIVWPESPAPFEEADPEFHDTMSRIARTVGAPVIVGNVAVDVDRSASRGIRLQNSADFFKADGTLAGRYDKMHLVPFGEYVPFRRVFFFAGSLLQDVGEFAPGVKRTTFAAGDHRIGTFICYESIFGDEVREYEELGADVLVNISNDGWYGDTSAPWEHLNMVRMRAIENHRWVLRATNSGVTAAIDPYGRVVEAAPRHIRTSLRVGFDYEHDVTFYARHGDWLAWLCCVVTGVAVLPGIASRRGVAGLRRELVVR